MCNECPGVIKIKSIDEIVTLKAKLQEERSINEDLARDYGRLKEDYRLLKRGFDCFRKEQYHKNDGTAGLHKEYKELEEKYKYLSSFIY